MKIEDKLTKNKAPHNQADEAASAAVPGADQVAASSSVVAHGTSPSNQAAAGQSGPAKAALADQIKDCQLPDPNLADHDITDLNLADLKSHLRADCQVEVYDCVGSTNDMVKERTLTERPLALVANQQTSGRGRLGRQFESPAGTGLYMTIALKPNFDISEAPFVTMAAAVAVCHAVQKVAGITPAIKWVNDVFHKNKKICGILTEATVNPTTGKPEGLVIGIGLNCFPGSFPPEIAHIAGPISDVPGAFSRSQLAAELINETLRLLSDIQSRAFLAEYRDACLVLGRTIQVHPTYGADGLSAHAISIAADGGLVVRYLEGPLAGQEATLHTGEISISL